MMLDKKMVVLLATLFLIVGLLIIPAFPYTTSQFIFQSTTADYNSFISGGLNGKVVFVDGNKFGFTDVNGGSGVDTNWETSWSVFDSNMKATYQTLLPSTPIDPTNKYLNGNLEWSGVGISGGGFAADVWFSIQDSDVNDYKQISYVPDVNSTIISSSIPASSETLFRNYLYFSSIDTTTIDAGVWSFNYRVKVDKTQGVTQVKFVPFLRHDDNSETDLFSIYSDELNNTDWETFRLTTNQPSFSCVASDRFGMRVYGVTSHGSPILLSVVFGDGNGAYFNLPIMLRHSLLRDLNWVDSGHDGVSNSLAGFDVNGNAVFYPVVVDTNTQTAGWTTSTGVWNGIDLNVSGKNIYVDKNLVVNVNKLFVNGTTGNVGIGTTTPTSPLQVVGTNGLFLLSDNVTDNTQKVGRIGVPHYTSGEEPVAVIYGNASTANSNVVNFGGGTAVFNAATRLSFYTAANATTPTGTERIRIDNSGNVGIGTITPSFTLDVNGTFRVKTTTGLTPIYSSATGKVGINNMAPSYNLDINGSVNFSDSITSKSQMNASKMYISDLQNALYKFGSRGTITVPVGTFYINSGATPSSATQIANIFDGTWDNGSACVRQNEFVTLDVNLIPEFGVYGITYPGGYVYANFYYTQVPKDINFRYWLRDGTQKETTGITQVVTSSATYRIYKIGISASDLYMTRFQLDINGNTDRNACLAQLEYYLTRPSSTPMPVVSKYGSNKLYGDLSFGDENNVVKTFIESSTGSSYFNAGNVGIGVTAPEAYLHTWRTDTTYPNLQITGNGTYALFATDSWSDTASNGNFFNVYRGRGTRSSKTAVQSGDTVFSYDMYGYTNANTKGAQFKVLVDNTVSNGVAPMRFQWDTMNVAGTLTERMRLSSDGNLGIGTTNPSYKLDVNGTARFVGDVNFDGNIWYNDTYWDDVSVSLASSGKPGGKPPTFDEADFAWNFEDQALALNEQYLFGGFEMPHGWKLDTNLSCHIHAHPLTTNVGDYNFELTYYTTNIGAVEGTSKTITLKQTTDGTANKIFLSEFPDIDMTGKTLSNTTEFRLKRLSSAASDTFTGGVAVDSFGCHYQIDAPGSRQKVVK